ncbi:divalent-cation tolerance protein CutA [Lysobacter changpingensis]|jgi:periplasmic divalent cation tolerance protein|uniref:divalent-cation tolerance protein CutA n=1 Tax=Lysobacter changpingensis TaxID=2792784 RepID=UPI001A903657|nr:divalent-cation tolerance protein CutA [Lysobacter changpingensis]
MPTPADPRVRLVLSTCPDARTADTLATALVDERLAACVNVLPGIRSVYRWQGAVERGEEVLLLIKTTADRQDALVERLKALHPYELPEALAVEAVGGLAAYLHWVAEQTRDDD